MTRLHETIETTLPLSETFAFIADFANSEVWDPGTLTSARIGDGPVGVGATYALTVKMGSGAAPMTYTIETFEPDRRVVLRGEGERATARDDIRFEAIAGGGTRVDYTADIELKGWMRLLQPVLGGTFRKIGEDARTGMTQALAERAAAASAPANSR
ncbi:MAG: SRPBCC family protein [Candidatus Limnocylindrales bacterium]